MLLQRLAEYAQSQPQAAPFHRERRFAWQITLTRDGTPRSTSVDPLVEYDAKNKPRGVAHRVPAVVRTVGVAANLAADDVQYVLGWSDETTRPERVAQCHAAFVDLIDRWAASPLAADDPVPAAVAAFYRQGGPAGLERPEAFTAKDGVLIMVETTPAHQAPSAAAFWSEEVARRKGSSRQGLCLVCGQHQPLLDTVPGKIPQRLVPGATNDAALVSVNAAVFGYDLTTQLAATPLCLGCGEAVTAGLHSLLESSTTSTTAGGQDSKIAWWVSGGSDDAVRLLHKPRPAQVVALLQSLHHTTPPTALRFKERFHSVTVGGNVARVVVRDWVEMPLPDVEANIAAWFRDHELTPRWPEKPRHHSLGQFALVTGRWSSTAKTYAAFNTKGEGRPQEIYRDLTRTAVRGGPLPPSVLIHLLARLRADRHVDDARVALIRLALTRSRSTSEKPMPDLDPTSTDPAYVAGRLFAAYERLQADAHNPPRKDGSRGPGTVNVTFADRYLAGAIANPQPALLNGARDGKAWVKKLRRSHLGLATSHDKRLDELHGLLDAAGGLPARLGPEQQGRFVIGYHHQRAHQFTPKPSTGTGTSTDAATDEEKAAR